MKGQPQDDDYKHARKFTSSVYGDRSSVNQTLSEINQYTQKKGAAMAAELMMEDPSIYMYDEFLDDNQKKRDSIVENKKKDVHCFFLYKLSSRYISDILKASEKKRVETSFVRDKVQAKQTRKEQSQYGTEEVYVTANYKKKMEEICAQDKVDQIEEDYNKEHGMSKEKGVSSFYKSMYDGNQFVGGNRGLGFEAKNMVGKEIERRTKERDNIKNPEKILELSPVKQQTKSRSRSRSRERRSELVETRRLDDILEQKILQEELEAARLAAEEDDKKQQRRQQELAQRNEKAQKAKDRLQQRKEQENTN